MTKKIEKAVTDVSVVKEVQVIDKSVKALVAKARMLEVHDENTLVQSAELLSQLNRYWDSLKEKKDTVLEPLKLVRKAYDALFSPVEDVVEEAVDSLRAEQSRYQTKKVNEAKAEADRIASRVGEGKGKLTVATAARKMDEIEKPIEAVSTASGSLKFREVQKLKVWDETMVPREYLVLDESKILKALKAGVKVEGCEIETVQVPVNNR